MRFLPVIATICTLTMGFTSGHCEPIDLLFSPTGEAPGDQFGIAVAGIGDVNADGYDDIVVGADANDEGGTSAGKAYIYFGGVSPDTFADVAIVGQAGDFFGVSVSSAGDVNNDGFDDVIVGAHFNSDVALRAGKASVYFGGDPMDTVPDGIMYGERERDYFGISVAGGGDVNDDGYDDVVIGAYKSDRVAGVDTLEDVGRVYVYYGGTELDSMPDVVLTGANEGERFGFSVCVVGDANGDGYDDVLAGAYSYDEGIQINIGRAYLFFGGDSMDSLPDVIMTGEVELSYFGWSVSGAGDVNGSGHADMLVGAYGYPEDGVPRSGKVYLYSGGPTVDNIPDMMWTGGADSVQFGTCVSKAGDIDHDLYGDILIGADGDDEGGVDAGKVHVLLGDSLMSTEPDTMLTGEAAGDVFGSTLSHGGDVNLTGHADFVVGAWRVSNHSGRVYVFGDTCTSSARQLIRGDANSDSMVTMADPIHTLRYLYVPGSPAPPCTDAADSDDGGVVEMGDAIYTLKYLYVPGSPHPEPPFPDCGSDPTDDQLDCADHPCMGSR